MNEVKRSEDPLDVTRVNSEECGCGPTADEKRALWPTVNRRAALGLGALGFLTFGALSSGAISPAFAADYPSWDDVQAAKANEAAKGAEISRIQGIIDSLNSEVARTQAEAVRTSDVFYQAQQTFFEAVHRADDLQAQADQQAATATDAANKAGRIAAQLYRNGGDDTSMELFFAGSAASADDLLSRLGTMDKLIQRNQAVYADAVTARDSAQNLSNQASAARDERDRLQKEAEAAMLAAQNAADAAQAALAEQEANLTTLQAQLMALQDTTAKTIADYQAGVEAARLAKEAEERRQREEAERLAREAAARRQQEIDAAAAAAAAGGGGGGGGSGGGGGGSGGGGGGGGGGSGWVRPNWGNESSGYGPRYVQCGNGYCSSGFHEGVDLAQGCGSAIYAASSGTVTYAGYNGGYGNYVRIDHGGGIGTGYGHIRDGGIYVRRGQWVNAGDVIAAEGNTGNSFGCHLHFEVYIWGATTNPVPFMADRGISV
ncbi:M23 family metallopeptidase [Microbacterium lemovicicum]|uniref:M23 family metallopeptidase n=1 Tax=Microbacterium lemovicicum TaxID=1072463 RepID=UPI001F496BEC|nr:M23 family metallopeptidase [Microbacterium lemovicicum]